jgi:alpha-amylase/alpha-mannosidase (GH57 family)
MHQPYYREGLTGDYHLPWVYLHGIKDYTDMAAHLENNPNMRLVVNFAPVLLEQLDDYAVQIQASLERGQRTSDPLLNLLSGIEPIPEDAKAREKIISDCQRCYAPQMIEPYPVFHALVAWFGEQCHCFTEDEGHFALIYLNDQYFIDILVWYHLSWLGVSLKKLDAAQALLQKKCKYSLDDRRALLGIIHDALAGIIPRYKNLADRGQIELAMTPYGHPIVPLLNNFDNMRCALPDAQGPDTAAYPDGNQRARWHMAHGIELFEKYFENTPKGIWLSEGGVSSDAIQMLDEFDISWTASGEGVWRNSCTLSGCEEALVQNKRLLFKPFQYQSCQSRIFFRDDGLSDRVGFEYSKWDHTTAVADFSQNLENIAHFLGEEADQHVVSVILDGENAWEYYPNNGWDFLNALYASLSANPKVNTITFSEAAAKIPPKHMEKFCAGSWVYGTFSTWIGQTDKNRAWEYLIETKQTYDKIMATNRLSAEERQQAERQLAICEGSDWFWWFGDCNPSDSVKDFDNLFRVQLKSLYKLLGEPIPEKLNIPLSQGCNEVHIENAGTMRRNT